MGKFAVKAFALVMILMLSASLFSGCADAEAAGEGYTDYDDLKGKIVGYLIGASYTGEIEKRFSESKTVGYNDFSEMIQALKSGKIDAYFADEPIGRQHLKETEGLKLMGEPVVADRYGFVFNNDKTELRDRFNEVIAKYKEDGTLEQLKEKWIVGNGEASLEFDSDITTPNGVLEIATVVEVMPFAYMSGDSIVGYDVALMYLICEELGYKPNITVYQFDGLLPGVTGGRADVGIGCITYTEERGKTLLFTESVYDGGPIAVVLGGEEESLGLFESLKQSFEKTLIVEDRWKLILNGLWVTVQLSVFSVLLGTILGFGFSFLLRSKNKFISGASNLVSIVLDGLPILIVLMVLYYAVFAKTNLSALFIGVLGLSLDFANTVAGTLNTGLKAIDKGQIEAAEAMGYSRFMVFRKIAFPQAVNQMFGSYSVSIISLIKDTSIIGYITVQDLTQAMDIIRSRTFEAFFPLILTAIIYFVIARLLVALLSVLAKKIDPKHRRRIVKGVVYRD